MDVARPTTSSVAILRLGPHCPSTSFFFFFNDTATTEIYTLSPTRRSSDLREKPDHRAEHDAVEQQPQRIQRGQAQALPVLKDRSEEHTSELQSPCNLVCRLLLEKKKKIAKSRFFSE